MKYYLLQIWEMLMLFVFSLWISFFLFLSWSNFLRFKSLLFFPSYDIPLPLFGIPPHFKEFTILSLVPVLWKSYERLLKFNFNYFFFLELLLPFIWYFIWNLLKNAFYLTLKALFVLKIFKFLSSHFSLVEKLLDQKNSFEVYYGTAWERNNCTAHFDQYLKR